MTNEIELVQKNTKEIGTFNEDLKNRINSLKVFDNASLISATDLLKQIKTAIKKIKERELEYTKPLNDTVKKIRAEYKPHKDFADKLKTVLEQEKILPYQLEQERIAIEKAEKERQQEIAKAKAEQEALELEAEKNKSEEVLQKAVEKEAEIKQKEVEQPKINVTVKSEQSTTSIRKSWVYEIENPELVPIEFCEPSNRKINNAVKSGVRFIKGVKIYEKSTIVSR